MQVYKKETGRFNWLKKNETIKNGDIIKFLDEGTTDETGKWGPRDVYLVKGPNGEGHLPVNQTSTNNMIDGYGDQTTSWIGKQAYVHVIKQLVQGKLVDILYLTLPGLDLEGKPTNPGEKPNEIPVVESESMPDSDGPDYEAKGVEEKEIDTKDIPF